MSMVQVEVEEMKAMTLREVKPMKTSITKEDNDSDNDIYEDASEVVKPSQKPKTFSDYLRLAEEMHEAEKAEIKKEDKLVDLIMRVVGSELSMKLGSSGEYLAKQLDAKVKDVMASGRSASLMVTEVKEKDGNVLCEGLEARLRTMEAYYSKENEAEKAKEIDMRHVAYNEVAQLTPPQNNFPIFIDGVQDLNSGDRPISTHQPEKKRVVARRLPRMEPRPLVRNEIVRLTPEEYMHQQYLEQVGFFGALGCSTSIRCPEKVRVVAKRMPRPKPANPENQE